MIVAFFPLFTASSWQSDPYAAKREEMVRTQLIPRGITSKEVLMAFKKVPRHLFVPQTYLHRAYDDQPLPIGKGQTISQPFIVAYMTEALEIKPGDKVLEIGTGSGYQAAILAEMGADVYTVEVHEELSLAARKVLDRLEYSSVHVKAGDGHSGWSDYAPYDAILVTCAPSRVPPALKEQLKEGGRMIIPVGEPDWVQFLYYLEKRDGKVRQKNVMSVRFVPMTDSTGTKY